MARRTSSGRFIISAGEVGTYTVCPESWRLRQRHRDNRKKIESTERGERLHHEWAKAYGESVSLVKYAKIIIALLAFATVIHTLFNGHH